MEQNLEIILSKLNDIQIKLRKLGPTRRVQYAGNVSEKNLQAEKLFLAYKDVISSFKTKETTVELAEYVHDILRERIELTYKKILTYKISNFEENITVTNMEKFDIKTATSLIPVMDNSEQTIEKIIDGIEMYNEYLVDTTQKKLLITFVLKTRLSKSAK